jgi:large subunit ribosomal protein L21e
MLKRKNIRTKGKVQFSNYFQEFKEGDKVAIVRDQTFHPSFPLRIQGLTGIVEGKRGRAYIIQVKDGGMIKRHIITPANLKKLK